LLLPILADQQISLKANLLSYLRFRVRYYYLCLESAPRALAQDAYLSQRTHTNRLFLLSFKELFASFRRYRSSEEVRIIETKFLLSTNFYTSFFLLLFRQLQRVSSQFLSIDWQLKVDAAMRISLHNIALLASKNPSPGYGEG
jgi:hypothetical protein